MTIFVDPLLEAIPRTAQARKYGQWWAHLTTDGDLEELHQFAQSIGLKRSYFQRSAVPHYDLTPNKRKLAVEKGAVEKSPKDLSPLRRYWMARWHGGSPDWEA
jgi:hypothetical protein